LAAWSSQAPPSRLRRRPLLPLACRRRRPRPRCQRGLFIPTAGANLLAPLPPLHLPPPAPGSLPPSPFKPTVFSSAERRLLCCSCSPQDPADVSAAGLGDEESWQQVGSGRRSGQFAPFFEGGGTGADPRLQEVGSRAMLPLSRARPPSCHMSGALSFHPLPPSRSPGA
jgi:hypothetical protein